jgi:hypothetical protein
MVQGKATSSPPFVSFSVMPTLISEEKSARLFYTYVPLGYDI